MVFTLGWPRRLFNTFLDSFLLTLQLLIIRQFFKLLRIFRRHSSLFFIINFFRLQYFKLRLILIFYLSFAFDCLHRNNTQTAILRVDQQRAVPISLLNTSLQQLRHIR